MESCMFIYFLFFFSQKRNPQKYTKELNLQNKCWFGSQSFYLTLLIPLHPLGGRTIVWVSFYMPTTIQVCSFQTFSSLLQFIAWKVTSLALSSLDNDLIINQPETWCSLLLLLFIERLRWIETKICFKTKVLYPEFAIWKCKSQQKPTWLGDATQILIFCLPIPWEFIPW